MVSRSLTEVFVLMRNNAMHSRQIFSEQSNDTERVRLMRSGSRDIESGAGIELRDSNAAPPWTDALEEAHYVITRLRTKLSELQSRQEKQIRRPALDEADGEQRHIARAGADLARLFHHAHAHLAAIRRHAALGNKTEQKLGANVVLALVTTLQELSVTFRSAQANYLKSLTSREERSNAYFDTPNFEELSLNETELLPGLTNNQTDLLFSLPSTSGTQNFIDEDHGEIQHRMLNHQQMLLLEQENTAMIAQREQEVNKIVSTITDLNDIFKDLGSMVLEQGTVLDRIDYNIEQTQVQVHEGYKQLQKAERYQRNNRKMHCILILAVTLIVMVLLLIIVKS